MQTIEALPMTHSWPLFERGRHFALGHVFEVGAPVARAVASDEDVLAQHGTGLWACDLADNRLTWSTAVYDLFGWPRGTAPDRSDTAALYAEPSRAAMERLRAHAIRHRRGFTLDAEILPIGRAARWIRLVAMPVCDGGRVVRLQGSKQDISDAYRR